MSLGVSRDGRKVDLCIWVGGKTGENRAEAEGKGDVPNDGHFIAMNRSVKREPCFGTPRPPPPSAPRHFLPPNGATSRSRAPPPQGPRTIAPFGVGRTGRRRTAAPGRLAPERGGFVLIRRGGTGKPSRPIPRGLSRRDIFDRSRSRRRRSTERK